MSAVCNDEAPGTVDNSLQPTGGRREVVMRQRAVVLVLGAFLALAAASPVFADQPPGQLGYEGQPGNQGGH